MGGGKSPAKKAAVKKVSGNPATGASALSHSQANDLKDLYESNMDAATQKSVAKYISNTNFDGDSHSLSQTMNYIINNGVDLQTATKDQINKQFGLHLTDAQFKQMQKTDANIDAAMHPIGVPAILQRGAHAGELVRNFGIKNYQNMTEAQLKKALVGATFQNKAVMSTSFDVKKNPFLGSGPAAGGREVVYSIKAGAGTPMVWGAMNQSEAILGKNINWRITNVRFTGKTAYPKKGGAYPQVEIEIETY